MNSVASEMTRRVMFAYETDPLEDVWATMKTMSIRHLPIVRERRVVGILSDRDCLKLGKQQKDGSFTMPSLPVGEVMTKNVVTCNEYDSVGAVAKTFLAYKIDSLPVVGERGELKGIITSSDLLRLLRDCNDRLQRELPFRWEPEFLLREKWRPADPC